MTPRATPLPPDERRAAILAATEPLVERHGRAVSTRQIADAAGVAEGTIFRVFPSKDALVDACIEEAFAVAATCRRLQEIDPEADLASRLVQAVTVLQERLRRVFALFHGLALSGDAGRPGPRSESHLHAKHRQDEALLTAALAQVIGADASALRVDRYEAAALLRTLAFSMSHPLLSEGRPSDPWQVVDLLLHGITRSDRHERLPEEGPAC